MSPAAYTPGSLVAKVSGSAFTVPQRVSSTLQPLQIFSVEAERRDDEIAGDFVGAAGLFFRRLAAAFVGRAELHAHGFHRGRFAGAHGFRRGEPIEGDALFFRVRHFALRARHVGAVAAIEAGDACRALAARGADAIHRRVAAADDDDAAILGVERAAGRSPARRRRGRRGWRR